jgi:hypothetical protein
MALGRAFPIKSHHSSGQPFAKVPIILPAKVISQATARALIGRGAPSYQVRWTPVKPPLHRGLFVSQARRAPGIGRTSPNTLTAPPLVPPPALASLVNTIKIFTLPPRSLALRSSPQLLLASPIVEDLIPVLAELQVSTTIFHALPLPAALRKPLQPQYAGPIVASFLQPVGFALPIVFSPPTPSAALRSARKTRVAPPALRRPGGRGTFILRGRGAGVGRSVPLQALVAAPNLALGAVPSGTFVQQTVARTFRPRSVPLHAKVAAPVLAPSGFTGTFVRQAIARALTGRSIPLHVRAAQPSLAAFPFEGTFVLQNVARAYRVRSVPLRTRVALPIVLQQPVTNRQFVGTFVYQAISRASRRPAPPKPRLALRTLVPPPWPITVKLQATSVALIPRRRGPWSRVALPALGPIGVFSPGTYIYQAKARALTGRTVPRLHLPGLGYILPSLPATVVCQALRRPLVGRTVPKPHLPGAVVGKTPLPPGISVSQALRRSYWSGLRSGHFKTARPVLIPGKAPGTLVVTQTLQRPLIGRRIIPAHCVGPVLMPAGPGATLKLQAVARAWRPGRRPPVPTRYLSLLVVPTQPTVTLMSGTGAQGTVKPTSQAGTVSPYPF